MTDTAACDVCGAEKPAAVIERTTVELIAPMEAQVCRACQLVQDHEPPEDVCRQCGDRIETGFYFEVEFPLGEAALPGFMSGTLCADCAEWIATDVSYDDAHERHLELLDEECEAAECD